MTSRDTPRFSWLHRKDAGRLACLVRHEILARQPRNFGLARRCRSVCWLAHPLASAGRENIGCPFRPEGGSCGPGQPGTNLNRYRPADPPTARASVLGHAQAERGPSTCMRALGWPPAASQIRAVPSLLAVASQVPSGATATAVTQSVWFFRTARSRPVAISQIRAVPSLLAVASQVPSGPAATALTKPVSPSRARSRPVAMSQTRTGLSLLPVASQVPSGAAAVATALTEPAGLPRRARSRPVAMSQTRTGLSLLPVASQVPSGATVSATTVVPGGLSRGAALMAGGDVPDPDRPFLAGDGEPGAVRRQCR